MISLLFDLVLWTHKPLSITTKHDKLNFQRDKIFLSVLQIQNS
jgi:hypothetical protein